MIIIIVVFLLFLCNSVRLSLKSIKGNLLIYFICHKEVTYNKYTWGAVTLLVLPYALRRHVVGIESTVIRRSFIVSRQRVFLAYFGTCSSQRSSKQAWQNSSYFITLHCAMFTHKMAATTLDIS